MFTFILDSSNKLDYMPIGGLSILTLSFAEYYQHVSPVKIIASKESYVYKYCTTNNINIQFVDIESDYRNSISDNDVLFITYRKYFPLHLNSNPRLFCWVIGPTMFFNWIEFRIDKIFFKSTISKIIIRRIITELSRNKALFFMDSTCKEANERYFGLHFGKIHYLPIPITQNSKISISRSEREVKNITYLGRGWEIWKIKPLKHICKGLAEECSEYRFNIKIITDTNDLFKKELQELSLDNVDIEFVNGYSGEKLRNYLITNSDLHIAMGTSALEGAICGIPTILIDASEYEFPSDYKYKWLYETIDYSLGEMLEINEKRNPRNIYTLREIISILQNPYEYSKIAQKTYEYAYTNHSPGNVFKMIDDFLPDIKVRYRDITKYLV